MSDLQISMRQSLQNVENYLNNVNNRNKSYNYFELLRKQILKDLLAAQLKEFDYA